MRFERFKLDEEVRRKLDQEESIYQAKIKKEILDKVIFILFIKN